MYINDTRFGVTKKVKVSLHNMEEDERYDEVLWVERGEDWYALMSPQLKNKKVVIVTREEWLKGEEVNGSIK